MDLNSVFFPLHAGIIGNGSKSMLGQSMRLHVVDFPALDDVEICLIGTGTGNAKLADEIRTWLYGFYGHGFGNEIADLGNFIMNKEGDTSMRTLTQAVFELITRGIRVVLFGDLAGAGFARKLAEGSQLPNFTYCEIDAVPSGSSRLTGMGISNTRFGYINLGYQTYYTDPILLQQIESGGGEFVRIGELRGKIYKTEPYLRRSDMVSVSLNAAKNTDVPGQAKPRPNGFSGDEMCALTRYAGTSAAARTLLVEGLTDSDRPEISTQLTAQMIWYFIDGHQIMIDENPLLDDKHFIKYIADLNVSQYPLVFYKSTKTQKWWMYLPVDDTRGLALEDYLIPCSASDYEDARYGEIPDAWLKAVSKLKPSKT